MQKKELLHSAEGAKVIPEIFRKVPQEFLFQKPLTSPPDQYGVVGRGVFFADVRPMEIEYNFRFIRLDEISCDYSGQERTLNDALGRKGQNPRSFARPAEIETERRAHMSELEKTYEKQKGELREMLQRKFMALVECRTNLTASEYRKDGQEKTTSEDRESIACVKVSDPKLPNKNEIPGYIGRDRLRDGITLPASVAFLEYASDQKENRRKANEKIQEAVKGELARLRNIEASEEYKQLFAAYKKTYEELELFCGQVSLTIPIFTASKNVDDASREKLQQEKCAEDPSQCQVKATYSLRSPRFFDTFGSAEFVAWYEAQGINPEDLNADFSQTGKYLHQDLQEIRRTSEQERRAIEEQRQAQKEAEAHDREQMREREERAARERKFTKEIRKKLTAAIEEQHALYRIAFAATGNGPEQRKFKSEIGRGSVEPIRAAYQSQSKDPDVLFQEIAEKQRSLLDIAKRKKLNEETSGFHEKLLRLFGEWKGISDRVNINTDVALICECTNAKKEDLLTEIQEEFLRNPWESNDPVEDAIHHVVEKRLNDS